MRSWTLLFICITLLLIIYLITSEIVYCGFNHELLDMNDRQSIQRI
jgi:hypothetical protein